MKIPASASPEVQQAFRDVWAALAPLIAVDRSLDVRERRISNLAPAIKPSDAATLADVRRLLSATTTTTSSAQTASAAAWILSGTFAAKVTPVGKYGLTPSFPIGTLYWETDRTYLFRVKANLSGTLGWYYTLGTYRDVYANRPVTTDMYTVQGEGALFQATDCGKQVWRFDGTGDKWVLQKGFGGPMRGTLVPDERLAGLTADDEGFRFYATDTGGTYRWDGAAWELSDLSVGKFGCNGAAAQTAYASGGALSAYGTGAFGFDSDAHASELHAMVVKIRAALVAAGIMS